jgi:hypothetical protein
VDVEQSVTRKCPEDSHTHGKPGKLVSSFELCKSEPNNTSDRIMSFFTRI